MSSFVPLKVVFKYEDCLPPRCSPLVDFALRAQGLVSAGPMSSAQTAFAQAAGLSAAVLPHLGNADTGGAARAAVLNPTQRLRCIETSLGMLEHSYDAQGRLTKTVYPDNETCAYEYDEFDRLAGVSSARQRVRFRYGAFGQLREIAYGGATIAYDHDAQGRLRRVTFPDRAILEYRYAADGTLTDFLIPEGRFHYEWHGPTRLATVEAQTNHETPRFVSGSSAFVADAALTASGGGAKTLCALGIWRTLPSGELAEMTCADGGRMSAVPAPSRDQLTSWSLLGRQVCWFSKRQIAESCCHEDGTRSVFRAVPDGTQALLIGHDAVVLYEYSAAGQLQRRRHSSGPYWVLESRRAGRLAKIEYAGGSLRLGFDANQRLRSWKSDDLAGRFDSHYAGVRLSGSLLSADPLAAVAKFRAIAWEWGAMRPTLRLVAH